MVYIFLINRKCGDTQPLNPPVMGLSIFHAHVPIANIPCLRWPRLLRSTVLLHSWKTINLPSLQPWICNQSRAHFLFWYTWSLPNVLCWISGCNYKLILVVCVCFVWFLNFLLYIWPLIENFRFPSQITAPMDCCSFI